MVDASTVTRRSALALIGGGAVLTAAETFGFTNVTANRLTDVDVAEDPNAFLGITGTNDPSTTPTFTNNSSGPMTVTVTSTDGVEFDVGDGGNWGPPPVSFSLAVDESRSVGIRFAGECSGSGYATVNVQSDLDGGADGSIDLTRKFYVPEAGQIRFEGTAESAGGSGMYTFEMENTGCYDVEFTGIGINETTTDAEYVSGSGSLFNLDTDEEVVTDRIPIDSSNPDDDTRREFNAPVPLTPDESVTFRFRRFKRSGPGQGGQNVNMQGEDVRATIYLSDGSDATIELCLNDCDF